MVSVKYSGTPGKCDDVANLTLSEVIRVVAQKGGLAIPAHVDK